MTTVRALSVIALLSLATMPAQAQIRYTRPIGKAALEVFEPSKTDTTKFDGNVKITFGGAFAQDFQNLTHTNTASPLIVGGVNQNQLVAIGPGFNTAMANLDLNVQLTKGIRVSMTQYLSTRHHTDTWAKGGFLAIDESPWDIGILNEIFKYTTVRVGQYELNYGDSHYRRTDAGNGMQNPFVGNLIMDAFSTEIGADVTVQYMGLIGMIGLTNGTSYGQTRSPGQHQDAFLGKVGFDEKLSSDLRVRLTGSFYSNAKSLSNVLYTGDRGGSHYFSVLENTSSTEASPAWSGNLQPGFNNRVKSFVVNPYIKYQGLELFGNIETSSGGTTIEKTDRTFRQLSGDVVYRFMEGETMYLAARYNTVIGQPLGVTTGDVTINRYQLSYGLFMSKNILAKIEYVNQDYNNYPSNNIRNGGNFKGVMFEGTVQF
jgi:hypothetical protein